MPATLTKAHFESDNYKRWLVEATTTVADIGQQSEVTFVYVIMEKIGAVIDFNGPDYWQMTAEQVIPMIGDGLASWQSYVPGSSVPHPTLQLARCRSITFQSLKQGGGGCQATVVFTTMAAVDPDTYPDVDPQNQGDVIVQLPSNIEYNASMRSMNVFRQTWTVAPPTNANTSAEIGGTAANANKGTMVVEVPQVRLRLRLMRDASVAQMKDNGSSVTTYLGKINSQTFFTFPAGTVVCEGFNMIHLNHEYYEVIVDFLYDAYAHHEQVPKLRADGKIEINSSGEPVEVKWKRIDRTSADFNNLIADPNIGALIERGWWDV